MKHFYLSDGWLTHPAIAFAGEDAAMVFTIALGISAQYSRGGLLTAMESDPAVLSIRSGVLRLSPKRVALAIERCIAAGLFERADSGGLRILFRHDLWRTDTDAEAEARSRSARVAAARSARQGGAEQVERGHVSHGLRYRVLRKAGFRCAYCGVDASKRELVVDHIVPVSKGGPTTLQNLTAACQPCNSGKGAGSVTEETKA